MFSEAATTEVYALSLHDALPISQRRAALPAAPRLQGGPGFRGRIGGDPCAVGGRGPLGRKDRKSTRLNSSHLGISYAVFCLKNKKRLGAVVSDAHRPGTPRHLHR